MSDKYFFGKCGGEVCPFRRFHNEEEVEERKYSCGIDFIYCPEMRGLNCPHGKTLKEWAKIAAKSPVVAVLELVHMDPVGISKAVIEALLGGGKNEQL